MIEEKKCPKCGKKEKVKNGFMKGKQRYKCKCCRCNYKRKKRDNAIKIGSLILIPTAIVAVSEIRGLMKN